LFEKGKDARDDVWCSGRLQEVTEEERCRRKTKSADASPLPRLSPRLLSGASTLHAPTIFYTNVSLFPIPTTQILPDLSSDGIIRPGRSSPPERKTFPQTRSFRST
jgi:hypothetical protein